VPPPWRGGRRPPWWPEGEAWPPRRRSPPFLFLLPFFLVFIVLYELYQAVAGRLGFEQPWRSLAWYVAIAALGSWLVLRIRHWRGGWQSARSARRVAEEQRRRSFLADVAHELKTPLAVIRGHAEGIADGVYPPTAESVAPILDATRTLEVLIEDLRTLGLSEAGALTLNREPVDLAVLVNDLLATVPHDGVELRADVPADLPPAYADPVRLRGVLNNLVANALRHTPPGGTVTVAARQGREGTEVSVSDTGTGIPPDLLLRVFDRFAKGPGSPGSGLGLAIAKDVVEAHGGAISAQSQPGKGTTVRFTLPPPP
jgi:signal transduction histidine kinase